MAKSKKKPPAKKPRAKPTARAASPVHPKGDPPAPDAYAEHRESMAAVSRERSASGRDIGEIPAIQDPERRERCRSSLRLFCDTYNPAAFALPWSDDQLESVARIEEAVTLGALYAMAEPRGGGKTTRTRMAALWALAYAHRRYPFVIGATDPKATDTLDALKTFMRFLPRFAEDFPEISYPVQRLEGIAHRAAGQTCGGKPTMIEWKADVVVLATVPPPAGWQPHWPLRSDGMVPTSGNLVSTSGLTGEGIRGSVKTLTTGEQVRPDFVLLDDPQTNESARSRTQNATRLQLVMADVLGMAGPGKPISAVMPCTVIERNDVIDQLTDRAKHPLWRGVRRKLLKSMPEDLAAWDRYFEVYRRCALKEPPDFAESNGYYLAHREELDRGAAAGWEARKLPTEVSAIQSAMHLYYRDRRAFMAEYQNDPVPLDLGAIEDLEADEIRKKVSGLARLTVPRQAVHLTGMIDVQQSILFYALAAWGPDFSGWVIDYGAFPHQSRSYFAAADARPSLADAYPNHPDDTSRIFAGIVALADAITGPAYQREGGGELALSRLLVDAGKWDEVVREAIRKCRAGALLLPSKGYGIGASGNPMANWPARPGERRGDHWIERPDTGAGRGRLLLVDTNHWKSFTARRLLTPEMGAGSLVLFGGAAGEEPEDHSLFADHITAEFRVATKNEKTGRKVEEWKLRPEKPDNHWWDCLVGSAVAASYAGLKWSAAEAAGEPLPPEPPRKPVDIEELYKKARGIT